MKITRRAATAGGIGLLAGSAISSLARADWAPGEGLEEFWLATDGSREN